MKFKLIFLITCVLGLGGLGVSWFAGSLLIAPVPNSVGAMPDGIDGRTVAFASRSGSELHGWFFRGRDDAPGMLLMHGVRGNRREMLKRALWLQGEGYSVLLFDFQAHGESKGKKITFGLLEAWDAEAAFQYLKEQVPDQPIGVIGVSLGGASALLGSVAQEADVLVLESVYTTFIEAVANRIVMKAGPLGRHIVPLLTWQVPIRLGFHPRDLSPVNRIQDVTTPVMILVGSEDRRATVAQTRRLFQNAAGTKELWILPGAAHENLYDFGPQEYEQRVGEFLRRVL